MGKKLLFFYLAGISSVISVSAIIWYVSSAYRLSLSRFFYTAMYSMIALSLYLPVAQYLKYRSLNFYVDFSHWTNILYNISITGKPFNLSHELMHPGTINYLSVHFTPLIYILAIPFKLWPYSETLIILNFLLMMSAAFPLYKLASYCYNNKQFSLFMVVLLFWYPTFQYITLYEFEMIRFSIPIIFWMLYFWEIKRIPLYFFFVFLSTLVREEVGLTIAMFGVYLFLFEKSKKYGLITSIIGTGMFVCITQFIMPGMRDSQDYRHIAGYWFSAFGNNELDIIKGAIINPGLTFLTIFHPIKIANLFMYFLPLLFIPLLSPAVLISVLANFGTCLLSGSLTHISYMLYYLSPSIPFIFYAFIKGWPRFTKLLNSLRDVVKIGQKVDLNSQAMLIVFSGLMAANVFFGPSPISLQFWFKDLRPAPFRTQNFHHTVYKVMEHHRKVESFCNLIPDDSIVSAEQFLHPRLFKKKGAMVFPQLKSQDGRIMADYVLIDKSNPIKTGGGIAGSWDGLRKDPQHYYDLIEKDPLNWKIIKSEDGYFLYKHIRYK